MLVAEMITKPNEACLSKKRWYANITEFLPPL